jgi:hypothetical protein
MKRMGRYGPEWSGSGREQVVGPCGQSNEYSGFIIAQKLLRSWATGGFSNGENWWLLKCWEALEKMSNWWLFKWRKLMASQTLKSSWEDEQLVASRMLRSRWEAAHLMASQEWVNYMDWISLLGSRRNEQRSVLCSEMWSSVVRQKFTDVSDEIAFHLLGRRLSKYQSRLCCCLHLACCVL